MGRATYGGPALLLLMASAVAQAQSAAPITKGPYFLEVTGTSARVMVETESATDVSVRLVPESEALSGALLEAQTRRWRQDGRALGSALFEDLASDTLYRVELLSGADTASGSFRTAPSPDADFSFLVYGDNRTQHDIHQDVVRVMEREEDVRFLLHTGDMVEMGGRPRDWDAYFTIAHDFLMHHPIFPSLGNHELYGPGGAIAYARHFHPPIRGAAYYTANYGSVRVIALDSNEDWDAESEQLAWLRQTLAEGTGCRFTFVILHHAPVSSGPHGGHEGMMASGVRDLLRDADVDLVFSGHDHMYERGDQDGYKYIVTGGGGAPLYYVNQQVEGQYAFVPTYHYLRVDLVGDEIRVDAIKADGEYLERCSFVQGGPWRCGDGGPEGPISTESAPYSFTEKLWITGVALVIASALAFWWWRRRKRRSK